MTKAEVIFKKFIGNIKIKSPPIGHLQLVNYHLGGKDIPYIEYKLYEKQYRNLGIMSRVIKEYLGLCKEKGYCRIMAQVKKTNIASIKILLKNGFIKLNDFDDTLIYIINMECSKEQLRIAKKLLNNKLKNEKFNRKN